MGVWEHAPPGMHFCIKVADVDLDAAILPGATATSGVSNVDASPNHMTELRTIK